MGSARGRPGWPAPRPWEPAPPWRSGRAPLRARPAGRPPPRPLRPTDPAPPSPQRRDRRHPPPALGPPAPPRPGRRRQPRPPQRERRPPSGLGLLLDQHTRRDRLAPQHGAGGAAGLQLGEVAGDLVTRLLGKIVEADADVPAV